MAAARESPRSEVLGRAWVAPQREPDEVVGVFAPFLGDIAGLYLPGELRLVAGAVTGGLAPVQPGVVGISDAGGMTRSEVAALGDEGADGFFECVSRAPLPLNTNGAYAFVTTFSDGLLRHQKVGGTWLPAQVQAEYLVTCEGDCLPPSAPPSPLPPPS